ncbi:MAG: outer membrane beta-barrel protein [Bacteroidales bacterium]|nr:outer membrane beta-barrel protein [Bacteroidales bacterium]
MKKIIILVLVLLSFIRLEAQSGRSASNDSYLQFGFKAGSANTSISGLAKVLVSESYYTDYTFENSSEWTFAGGIYLNYKFEQSISAIYSEIAYSRLGNKLHYSDIYDFIYDLSVRYDFLNLEFWYKAYIFNGLYLGTGPRLGFILTPGGLYYTSNGEDLYGPDIRIQQQMRDVLKGKNNICLGISTGYEFSFGLSVDVRFYYGLSDVMETEVNNFNFIENNNNSRIIQITLGYALPYNIL